MYKSPIELIVADIKHQIVKQQDEEIYKAVLHYIPNINKEELLLALNYDREQYEKGYEDAMASLVRCKDCKYYQKDEIFGLGFCNGLDKKPNDFCSYGERKDND